MTDLIKKEDGLLTEDMKLPTGINPRGNSISNMLFDVDYFEKLQRVAGMLECSNFVPKHYRNKADCAIALHMAYTAGIDPMFLLQNTYVVHGNPGWSGQAIIALINNSKRFVNDLNWEFERNDKKEVIKATCFAVNENGERFETSIGWDMVEGEKWTANKKWYNMREQMFCYRSATFFARRFCPDILLGIAASDEQVDMKNVTPTGDTDKAKALNEMAGTPPEEKEPEKTEDVKPVDPMGVKEANDLFEGVK